MILDKMNIFIFGWYEFYPLALVAISVLNFINLSKGNKNSAFWGTICGISGIFFLLRNFEMIEFIVLFAVNPKDWGVLIPGIFLTFFAAVFILDSLNIDYNLMGKAFDYWPVILIVVGIGLVFRSLRTKSNSSL